MNTTSLLVHSWQHRACALTVFTLLLGGCGGGTVFALKDPGYSVKPTSVSVITGGAEESDLKLAEYLTQELKDRTALQVVGQDEVSKVIPSYPIAIKTVEENNGEVAWVAPSEKARIEKIHAKLKTNYVFVIWSKRMMKNTHCSIREGAPTPIRQTCTAICSNIPVDASCRIPPSAGGTATASCRSSARRATTSTSCSRIRRKTSWTSLSK